MLTQPGVEIGLDAAALSEALSNGAYAEAVRADIMLAQQFGINAVPFFVFNRKVAVSGAQDTKVFLETMQRAP